MVDEKFLSRRTREPVEEELVGFFGSVEFGSRRRRHDLVFYAVARASSSFGDRSSFVLTVCRFDCVAAIDENGEKRRISQRLYGHVVATCSAVKINVGYR